MDSTTLPVRWFTRNRIRVNVAVTFVVLAAITIFATLVTLVIQQRNFRNSYSERLDERLSFVEAFVSSGAGQASLLNHPIRGDGSIFRPYLLNVSAVDVENPRKAQDNAIQDGCSIRYGQKAELCFALGNRQSVGAYLYVVGWVKAPAALPHTQGASPQSSSRLILTVESEGSPTTWLILFQKSGGSTDTIHLRTTGYRLAQGDKLEELPRADRAVRGKLIVQQPTPECAGGQCDSRWQFSFRVPLDKFRENAIDANLPWPPVTIGQTTVSLKILSPTAASSGSQLILDSNDPSAEPVYSLESRLGALLAEDESLRISRVLGDKSLQIWSRKPPEERASKAPFWRNTTATFARSAFGQLTFTAQQTTRQVRTGKEVFEIELRPSDSVLEDFMTPIGEMAFLVMLIVVAGMIVAWVWLHRRIVRPIVELTKRTAPIAEMVRSSEGQIPSITFSDLKSADELGVLAGGLQDLLTRVTQDFNDNRRRIEQRHQMWRAIGHEISSPLQSLSAMHQLEADPSWPYIQRMLRAMKALYGVASVVEADWGADLSPRRFDLAVFLRRACDASKLAGIEDVTYTGPDSGIFVRADESRLESVLEHILSNANRFRNPGSMISVYLGGAQVARITIFNDGDHINIRPIESIFDFGVTSESAASRSEHDGQGLWVSKIFATQMGASIQAENVNPRGVRFTIVFPCDDSA